MDVLFLARVPGRLVLHFTDMEQAVPLFGLGAKSGCSVDVFLRLRVPGGRVLHGHGVSSAASVVSSVVM